MKHFFTIEVYYRRKWSDKYSCIYSTREEAEERARELYDDEVDDGLPLGQRVNKVEPIHTCYRIKETKIEETTHEIE
jgi:hypothetical protein